MSQHGTAHQVPAWLLNDIAWLGTAPGMLRDTPRSLAPIRQACGNLNSGCSRLSDDQISALTTRRQGPLGRYFETLVQTVLSHSPQVATLHPNVIIQDGKRTCGELDLLYQCSGRWVHLELAVKFYIGLDNRRDPFQWHGPAARDTLGRKLKKLLDHQLRLPETDAGTKALTSLNIGDVHSEALVMGMLFHPFASWQRQIFTAPDLIAKNHPAGWWLPIRDLNQLPEAPEILWRVLSKPQWLSAAEAAHEELLGREDLSKYLNEVLPGRPVMLAAIVDGTVSHRGFVVPDDWPPLQAETGFD